MQRIQIQVKNHDGNVMAEREGIKEVYLVHNSKYQEGDIIEIGFPEIPGYYWVQFDDARERSLSYVTGKVVYQIPFGEKQIAVSPKAFIGERHLIPVRKAYDFEICTYRNLAFQPWDQHGDTSLFPHASANVETRGEAVFAALNAIDGCTVSHCHEGWPFQSWGINQNPKAEFVLDFGREIVTDRIVIYTRADYPHDNWWEKVTLRFSDESQMQLHLIKTGEAQMFTFEKKTIRWLKLCNLIKADDPSPFPALTQIEVYGTESRSIEIE